MVSSRLPVLALYFVGVIAGWSSPAPERSVSSRDALERIWDFPVLVDAPDAPVLQRLAILGRYHGTLWMLDSDAGNEAGYETRRLRIGLEARFLGQFEWLANFNLSLDGGRFFQDIHETALTWKPSGHFSLTAGKIKGWITTEFRTSTRFLYTFEQSLITNNVIPQRLWGVMVAGDFGGGDWLYEAGVFSAAVDPDFLWPRFDGGAMAFASIGRKLGADGGTLRLDYLWNSGDEGNNVAQPFEHTFSLGYTGEWKRFRAGGDAVYAFGLADRPNIWGINIRGGWRIFPKLEAVLRYTWAGSEGEGLSLQSRYERESGEVPIAMGSQYHALYGGMNYYIHGDKLKLMGGAEWAHMERAARDFEGVTLFAGIRLYF